MAFCLSRELLPFHPEVMGVLAKRSGEIFSISAASGLLRGLMKIFRFAGVLAVMLIAHCANIQKEDTGTNSAKKDRKSVV